MAYGYMATALSGVGTEWGRSGDGVGTDSGTRNRLAGTTSRSLCVIAGCQSSIPPLQHHQLRCTRSTDMSPDHQESAAWKHVERLVTRHETSRREQAVRLADLEL